MAKLSKAPGSTSVILQIFIRDSSSTTGAGLTALAFDTGGLTAYYHRDTDTTATAISLVTMTVGTFTSSGFKLIDDTNMPGWYQFCPPNACFATGAKNVAIMLKGAANMAPVIIEVDLQTDVNVTHVNGNAQSGAGVNVTQFNSQNVVLSADNYPRVVLADSANHGGTSFLLTGNRLVFSNNTSDPTWSITNSDLGHAVKFVNTTSGSYAAFGARIYGAYLQSSGAGAGLAIYNVDTGPAIDFYGGTGQASVVGNAYGAANLFDFTTENGHILNATAVGASKNAINLTSAAGNRVDSGTRAEFSLVRKNTAIANFEFPMYLAGTNTPATGKTVTAKRSVDGGAEATTTNSASIAEIGTTGTYKITLSTTDLNGAVIGFRFSAAGCDDTKYTFVTDPE